ncbi:hypothetical protein [Streptomyces sp. 2323.1]|uniref:hypothetical protein n=1 Tax=Streptomyces sp. 2323.1 TaxID=1938841 RepID=UPI000BB78F5A|nr:hypothetical protein [Streptomyces sp. 2323.1]
MDQGVAAVLAAGVAATVTLGGAVIAYQAGRRQVRDQGSIEHAHWMRGQREQAYLTFLASCERATAAGRLRRDLWERIEVEPPEGEALQELRDEAQRVGRGFSEAVDQILEPLERIRMLGPDVVINEAEYTLESVRQFEDSMVPMRSGGDPFNAEGNLRVQRATFAAVARQVLTHPQENITVVVAEE